jgi:phosphoglycolate phosphatase
MRDYTLVFDLDGTLVETAPDLIASVNHVLRLEGVAPVEPDLIRSEISHGAARMLKKAFQIRRHAIDDRDVMRLYETEYLPHYAANIAVLSRPYPGLVTALGEAAQRGAKLAVCTNKWEGLSRQLLTALGLDQHFAAIAGRDTFPVFKPHPDHLLGAIRLAGGDPSRAVMIGDSDTDIQTARAASIPVIAVTFGYTDVPVHELGPDAIIDHYDGLIAAIGEVSAG